MHALPLSSRAWLLLSCPTRDHHLLCLPCFPSVTATTGAASVLAEASPPSLAPCATSRTSTRAPLWTRPLAPCSRRSNGSPARLPPVGGLRRMGARVCNRCGQASQARPPRVGDVIMGPLGAPVSGEDTTMVDVDVNVTPSLTVDLYLPLTCRAISRSASVHFPQAPFCTSLPAAVCA